RLHERADVLDGAELGVHVLVPALLAADGPGTARVARLGHRVVVAALAMRDADGVDRRQVEHVEAHRRDVGEARLAVLQRAVAALLEGARSREHLVPGAEARALAVDVYLELAGMAGGVPAVGMGRHQRGQLVGQRRLRRLVTARLQLRGPRAQRLHAAAARPRRRLLDELGADQVVHRLHPAGRDLLLEALPPGAERI